MVIGILEAERNFAMKKVSLIFLVIFLIALCACNNAVVDHSQQVLQTENNNTVPDNKTTMDEQQFANTLSDWISGSDFGIISGKLEQSNIILNIPANRYNELTTQNKEDIESAISDILSHTAALDGNVTIIYETENERFKSDLTFDVSQQIPQQSAHSESTTNLIFIHHSCGENWLHDGLNQALNADGYHVADISYGWDVYGDNTDTTDWPTWFTDNVMNLVYNETNTISANNSIAPDSGQNEIIMFKSCYPNSDVGGSIEDEKAIYNSLLPYYEAHPDKMFILITPPPMIHISNPDKTRALCNWLVDRDGGWLSTLTTQNVFVFDFYNVLTHPDAHHYFSNGQEIHTTVEGENTLYYDSGGDDHPNQTGNKKATDEFMSLFCHWRNSI